MKAGTLRHRIKLLPPTASVNDAGETAVIFEASKGISRWADVQPLNAREIERARQAQMQTTHRVVIRRFPDIQQGWQIEWRGRRLLVTGIMPVAGRNIATELACQQVTQP